MMSFEQCQDRVLEAQRRANDAETAEARDDWIRVLLGWRQLITLRLAEAEVFEKWP